MAPNTAPAVEAIESETMRRVGRRLIPLLMICYFAAYLDRVNVGFAALTMNKALGLSAEIFGDRQRHLLPRLLPVRGPQQPDPREGRRAALDRADPDHLGRHLRRHRLRHRHVVLPRHPLPARARRGRLLPRHHPVSDVVVPIQLPVEDHRHLHDRDPDLHRHRLFDIQPDPASGRLGRPGKLAVAVHPGGDPGDHSRLRGDGLPDRRSGAGKMAGTGATRVAGSPHRRRASAKEARRNYSLAETMRHPRVWLLTLVYFGQNVSGYGLVIFLPQIVSRFGVGVGLNGVISALPFVAGAFAMVWWGTHADRAGRAPLPHRRSLSAEFRRPGGVHIPAKPRS